MATTCWTSKHFKSFDKFHTLHNPRVFADAFGLKRPLGFCAHEDCKYKALSACPAGKLKESCPNRSAMDYEDGCKYFYGKPYQAAVLQNSFAGIKPIHVTITGRGTGKSAVVLTNKALQECTVEPYIRMMLFKCSRPVPTIVVVVGNTKDTALLLRSHIHNTLESNDLLYSMVDQDTKTYIRFKNGSEIFIRTAGADGKTLRGFHADIMKSIKNRPIKTTIWFLIDEACFLRAKRVINEVALPSLQVGNTFSGLFITSTPWSRGGEVYDLWDQDDDSVIFRYNFSAFNNPFTNIALLLNFRRRMEKSGMGSLFNREVLGLFESDEGLFWPFDIWARSIDDSLDWLDTDDLKKLEGKRIPGKYYLGVDPNKFRQLESGDFAAYLLICVSGEKEHVRAVSYGKYLMDLEDTFLDKLELINSIFQPTVICDQNSGYLAKLRNMGMDVRAGSNSNIDRFVSMSIAKLDFVHDIFKQPSSALWEDERRSYVPKDPDPEVAVPKLDHKGEWGQGFTSDLMSCLSYCYQGIMEDFGIEGLESIAPKEIERLVSPSKHDRLVQVVRGNFDAVLRSSNEKFERFLK